MPYTPRIHVYAYISTLVKVNKACLGRVSHIECSSARLCVLRKEAPRYHDRRTRRRRTTTLPRTNVPQLYIYEIASLLTELELHGSLAIFSVSRFLDKSLGPGIVTCFCPSWLCFPTKIGIDSMYQVTASPRQLSLG